MNMWRDMRKDSGSKRGTSLLTTTVVLLGIMIVFQQVSSASATSRFVRDLPADIMDTTELGKSSQAAVLTGMRWILPETATQRRILGFGPPHNAGGPSPQGNLRVPSPAPSVAS